MSRREADALHQELAVGTFTAWKAAFTDELGLVWSNGEGLFQISPFVATRELSFSMKDAKAALRKDLDLSRLSAPMHYLEEIGLGRRMEVATDLRDFLECFRTPVTLVQATEAYCATRGLDPVVAIADLREGLQLLVESGFVFATPSGLTPPTSYVLRSPSTSTSEGRPVHAQLVDCLKQSWTNLPT
jgi:hypothetical protein